MQPAWGSTKTMSYAIKPRMAKLQGQMHMVRVPRRGGRRSFNITSQVVARVDNPIHCAIPSLNMAFRPLLRQVSSLRHDVQDLN
jgi:hypothetical protein